MGAGLSPAPAVFYISSGTVIGDGSLALIHPAWHGLGSRVWSKACSFVFNRLLGSNRIFFCGEAYQDRSRRQQNCLRHLGAGVSSSNRSQTRFRPGPHSDREPTAPSQSRLRTGFVVGMGARSFCRGAHGFRAVQTRKRDIQLRKISRPEPLAGDGPLSIEKPSSGEL